MSITLDKYSIKSNQISKIDKIKDLIWKQTKDHPLGSPQYYGVLYYKQSYDGSDLTDKDELRKRWDLYEVRKTHYFVNRLLRKAFGDELPIWWSTERHKDYKDKDGDTKKGAYHSNIFIGSIDDNLIEYKDPRLNHLYQLNDEYGIPIELRANSMNLEAFKLLLLNACIRQAKWVGCHPKSLELYDVPANEMEGTFMYSLKDYNSNMEMIDIIIDWKNSSYYTPN